MKRLLLLAALFATPASAEEAPKPPVWIMAVQIKATTMLNASYSTEANCQAAVKLITPHLKKIGRADCLPVLQQ